MRNIRNVASTSLCHRWNFSPPTIGFLNPEKYLPKWRGTPKILFMNNSIRNTSQIRYICQLILQLKNGKRTVKTTGEGTDCKVFKS